LLHHLIETQSSTFLNDHVYSKQPNHIAAIWVGTKRKVLNEWLAHQRKYFIVVYFCANFTEKFEDIKGRTSEKDTQYTGQTKKDKKNNDLQNTTQKTKDWAARTPQNTDGELVCCGRMCSSCSTSGNRRVTLVVSHKRGNDDTMATTTNDGDYDGTWTCPDYTHIQKQRL